MSTPDTPAPDTGSPRTAFASPLGPAFLVVLGLVVLSGLGLALHYFPATDTAHESVRMLEGERWGRIQRSAHHFGAIAVVALLIVQCAWVLFSKGYRGRGRWGWWALIGVLMALVFADVTGGLLPWDERAWHATDVRLGIAAGSPVIGPHLGNALRGGDAVAAPTLVRFYAMHLGLVPIALGAILYVWRTRCRKAAPIQPANAAIGALLALGAAAGLIYWAWSHSAPLGEIAAPGETGFEARPEWYMLWLFELLRMGGADLQDALGYGVPGLLVTWLLAVPLIDRKGEGLGRKIVLVTAGLWTLVLAGLSSLPLQDAPVNRAVLPQPEGLTEAEREGYLLVRTQGCCDCHAVEIDGEWRYFPDEREGRDEDIVSLVEAWESADGLESFELIVRDPFGELMTEEMPSYDHLTTDQIRSMYRFVETLDR